MKAKTIPARHASTQAFQECQSAGLVVQAIANLLGSWRVPSGGQPSLSTASPTHLLTPQKKVIIMLSGDRPETSRTLGFQTWGGAGFMMLHRPGLMFPSGRETFGRSSEEAFAALQGALAYMFGFQG